MSDRPRRNIQRFDFAVYGSDGRKVPPQPDMSTQSTQDTQDPNQLIKMEQPQSKTDGPTQIQSLETDQSLTSNDLDDSTQHDSRNSTLQQDRTNSLDQHQSNRSVEHQPLTVDRSEDSTLPTPFKKPLIHTPAPSTEHAKLQLNQVCLLKSDIELCMEEVVDSIDEHSIQNASVKDTDNLLNELKELRKGPRANTKTLLNVAPEEYSAIQPSIQRVFDLIKDFNVTAKSHIDKVNAQPSDTVVESSSFKNELEAMMFSANDIVDHINELKSSLEIDVSKFDDQELLQTKAELPIFNKKLNTIADRYERLIKFPVSNLELSKLIKNIGLSYKNVKTKKSIIASEVKTAIETREVIKFKSFDEAKLAIDL